MYRITIGLNSRILILVSDISSKAAELESLSWNEARFQINLCKEKHCFMGLIVEM